jgi:hypothetical protein
MGGGGRGAAGWTLPRVEVVAAAGGEGGEELHEQAQLKLVDQKAGNRLHVNGPRPM